MKLKEQSKKQKFGKYPYTYVRSIYMKKKLLSRSDYDKILKMTPNEISKYLEDLDYKAEIDELALKYKGTDLIERALLLNLGNEFKKLLRISPEELRVLIRVYLRRFDLYNIKTVIRAKFSGLSEDYIKDHIIPIGAAGTEIFDKLIKSPDIISAINILAFLSPTKIKSAIEHFKSTNSLVYTENALDQYYFGFVFSQIKHISDEGKLFKRFLMHEIDVINIRLILQLKHLATSEDEIKNLVIQYGKLKEPFINRLIKSDISGIIKELINTEFSQVFESYKDDTKIDFSLLERDLEIYLMNESRKLIKQHPMSVDVILGFILLKNSEVKNLLRIIKGKELGVSEEFIEKIVVI